jgi:cell division protein FtsZ
MTISLSIPVSQDLKPKIAVIGVGGAGGNAVNNMITSHLEGVEFIVANTDAQALSSCLTERRIQLGTSITHGLGAGARPEIGRAAAEEALEEILDEVQGSHMVFITAGMGGGTGTGAAPVIAQAVREQGILTVGVVTKPFHFEGAHRMRIGEAGLEELQQYVDTLIVIPNQNLFRIANEHTTFRDAFALADQVLHMGVRGVTDLMIQPGLINLDFADIRTVMSEMGKAMMGTGEADGEDRAVRAAEAAISNPLLDEVSMKGAAGVLINITGGPDMTLYEVDAAANRIKDEVEQDANIIFGSTYDEAMDGNIRVSVVATGIEAASGRSAAAAQSAQTAEQAGAQSPTAPFRFMPRIHKPQPYPSAAADQGVRTATAMDQETVREAAPGRIPTEPVQPLGLTARPRASARPEGEAVAVVDEETAWGKLRGDISGGNLLEKITRGLSRGRAEPPPAGVAEVREPELALAEAEPAERPAAKGDEDLDRIPAFLRHGGSRE